MLRLTKRESLDFPVTDSVALPFERRAKSRARVVLASGREAAILLERGSVLRGGDLLRGEGGEIVRIDAAPETVSVVHAYHARDLVRAAYHLGNRHVPVQIGGNWVSYLHDHVLDDMMLGLGMHVHIRRLAFEPEAGAYAGGGHGHEHEHEHEHGHVQVNGEEGSHAHD